MTTRLAGNSAIGTIVEVGQQGRARSYQDFSDAAITKFVVPGRHAASAATSSFTLTASVQRPGDHAVVALPPGTPVPSNHFRLAIDGLPMTRVCTIAPAFRRTTGGVVPSGVVVTFSDVVLAVDGLGAGRHRCGYSLIAVNECASVLPPADRAPPKNRR